MKFDKSCALRWLSFILLLSLSACYKQSQDIAPYHVPMVDPLTSDMRQSNFDGALPLSIKKYPSLARLEREIQSNYRIPQKERNSRGEKKIWLPPRLVIESDESPHLGPPLPSDVLLKVEVQMYPRIDCEMPDWRTDAVMNDYFAPMSRNELLARGEPENTLEIWVIPYVTGYYENMSINFGPLWLGNALRLAGKGRRVFFEASQNCTADSEYSWDVLPEYMFTSIPSGRRTAENPDGSMKLDLMHVSALRPYTVKVVEVCSDLTIVVSGKEVSEINKIEPRNTINYTEETVSIRAQCSFGEKVIIADDTWNQREKR